MDDGSRAGRNTKRLRKLHGDTQETLSKRIFTDRTTLSNYERGKGKGMPEDMIKGVSAYYMTSTDELIHTDIPVIEKTKADKNAMLDRIDAYFPFVNSKEAQQNRSFKKAVKGQAGLYEKIRKGDFSDYSYIPHFVELYDRAYEDSRCSRESAVNRAALFCLYTAVAEVSAYILSIRPSSISKIYEEKDIDKDTVISPEIILEMDRISAHLSSKRAIGAEDEKKRYYESLSVISSQGRYVQLGLFYLASGYVYDIIGMSPTSEESRNRGLDWMYSLYLMKNPYARRFFNI